MRSQLALCLLGSALAASACVEIDPRSRTKKDKAEPAAQGPVEVAAKSDQNGVLTATLSGTATGTQVVRGSQGSGVKDASLAVPAGALAIDTDVSIQEGAPVATADTAGELGVTGAVTAAGPAVVVSSATPIDASVPFTVTLPLSGAPLVEFEAFGLQDPYANLGVICKLVKAAAKELALVALPRSALTIGAKVVSFATLHFGSCQAAFFPAPLTAAIEKPTTKPIVTKNEAAATAQTPAPSPAPSPMGPAPAPGAFALTGPTSLSNQKAPLVTWSAAERAAKYRAKLGTATGCPTPLKSADDLQELTWSPGTLSDGSYVVCLEAVNADGLVTKTDDRTFTIDATPPGAFTLEGPLPMTGRTQPVVSWTPAVEAAAYDLIVASDPTCAVEVQKHVNLTATSKTLTAIADGTYYVCVTARDTLGNARAATNMGRSFLRRSHVIIGQPNGETISQLKRGLYQPRAVHAAGGKLFVVDTGNHRVLIYNSIPSSLGAAPDVVLGQTSFSAIVAPSSPTSRNVLTPEGIYSNGTWLAVSDFGYNRVLIWDTIPTSNNVPADRVLGQTDFTSDTSGTSNTTLNGPTGLGGEGDWLAVADSSNHRVLLFDMSPLPTIGGGASFVVGQATFSSDTPSAGAAGLSSPSGVSIHGNALFVADTGNERVQIFTSVPSSNGASATTSLLGGTESFDGPFGVAVLGTKLYVTSANDHRILGWNTIPAGNFSPDFVLGQADFTGTAANRGGGDAAANSLNFPVSIAASGGKLFVNDGSNNRILIWNAAPSSSGASADVVVGQRQFTARDDLLKDDVNAYELRMPGGVAVAADGTLFVADSDHHRVLRFNAVPQADGASAVAALGQPNLATATSPVSATATVLKKPRGVLVHGDRLLVADTDFHRVVGWSALPTASGAAADFALGAASPDATPAYSSSAVAFRKPNHLVVGGGRLYMTEQHNHRALIFNAVPTTSNTPATAALAQPDLTGSTPNNAGGTPSASSLSDPAAISTNGTVLAIADTTNNRVLIWNALPSTTDTPANVVLGQATFSSDGTNATGSATASSLKSPKGVLVQGNKLFVADTGNHRVLIWDTIPTSNGQLPDRVWGQPDFTSDTANNGGLGALSLAGPTKIGTDGVRVFIADEHNLRIVIRPLD